MLKLGLIGEKLGHSYSQVIHNKLGYEYSLVEVSPENLKTFVGNRILDAYNVTIPFKQTIIPFLDEIDKNTKIVGSVNTVVNRNGKLIGYNTDILGMKYALKMANIVLEGKKVLILGTGGTSLTAQTVAKDLCAKEIIIVGRKEKNNYNNINLHFDSEIIINTTPVGMYPNNYEKALDLKLFTNLEGVFDVIYNPLHTFLAMQAKELKVKVANGLAMLVAQAVYASDLFFGKKSDEKIIENIIFEIEKEKRNIVLIGMPGCGKSSIGKKLANITNKEFVDTDELIFLKTAKSCAQIITELGETEFRRIENEVVLEVAKNNSMIIATGGGVVLNKSNINALRQNAIIVFIDRDINKLSLEDRPLSASIEKLKQLYIDRKDLYEEAKDFKVFNNSDLVSCVKDIMELV